jgi:hypothetical protein
VKKQLVLLSIMILGICSVFAASFPVAENPNDEVIAKMKAALAPLFQENQDYTLSDISVIEASGGYKISATATFFQINSVILTCTFSSADIVARLELKFPDGNMLPESIQQKIAHENFTNRIPVDIRKTVELKSVYIEFTQNTIGTIGIQFAGQKDWSPVNGISAKNIMIDFNLNNPLGSVSVSSTLASNLLLGDVSIGLRATLSSNPNDCVLTGDISNLKLGSMLSSMGVTKAPEWPDALWNLAMSKGSVSIAPFAKTITLNTTSDFGQVEFMINGSAAPTEFMIGVAPPADFSFTAIDQGLGILDKVGLKNTGIVLASSTQKTKLAIFKKLGQETEVTRGITLLALYNISEMSQEVERLIGKSQLLLRTTLSNNPAELKLMASLDTNIPFDAKSNVLLKNVNFTIAPNPANFEVSLGGTMDVKVEKNRTLNFATKVAVNITNAELSIEGIMNGTWDRPFETNGVQLIDLGIGVGVSFKTTPLPMPTMQFKGKIKVGNPNSPAFAGDVTFALDPSNPTQCMIDAGFNQILMSDLVKVVQYSTPSFKVPEDSKNTVNSIAITDARLTIVPGLTPVTVLEKIYDPGFLIKGKSTIDGYSTNLLVGISSGGITAGAGISAIIFPPYFSFTGALGKPDPYFNLVLSTTNPKSSKVAYSGKATVLKLVAESDMMLSDQGFDLYMKGKIYDKFQAQLQIAAGSTKDGAGYNVKATMDSDLQKYISDIASAEIDKATKENQKAFREAQSTLTQKQKEVSTLNSEIEKQRAIVQAERDKDCKKFKDAEAEVKKDQKKVNKLKDDINENEDKIKKLAKAIDKDITKAPENGAKITKLKAEQASMETALASAKAGLKISEKALDLLGSGCDLTPIDLDPRIAGLITARETADKSLQAAKVVVGGTGAITGGSLKATKYIVEKGSTGVVTITFASFESKLSTAEGGMVSLKVKGTYSGEPLDKSFIINLPSPQETVETFARELLK